MTNRTPNQILAALLRRNAYAGCRGQISSHGAGRKSIQIFADAADPRFRDRPMNEQGSRLVLDFDLNA